MFPYHSSLYYQVEVSIYSDSEIKTICSWAGLQVGRRAWVKEGGVEKYPFEQNIFRSS